MDLERSSSIWRIKANTSHFHRKEDRADCERSFDDRGSELVEQAATYDGA